MNWDKRRESITSRERRIDFILALVAAGLAILTCLKAWGGGN